MDLTRQNLENRNATIRARLGLLAYERREHQIKVEQIDEQVAAMEAQAVLIEATLSDLNADAASEAAEREKELANTKEKRSVAAKAAVEKRKREKARKGPARKPRPE